MAIAQNLTEGYGYNYCSLSDLVKQGYKIPIMRTKVNEFGEYIEWYDDKNKEWYQGARVETNIRLPKGNACQNYGAALSYARRYTAFMALGLATDDDKGVEDPETVSEDNSRKVTEARIKKAFDEIKANGKSSKEVKTMYDKFFTKPTSQLTDFELVDVAVTFEKIAKEVNKNGSK